MGNQPSMLFGDGLGGVDNNLFDSSVVAWQNRGRGEKFYVNICVGLHHYIKT